MTKSSEFSAALIRLGISDRARAKAGGETQFRLKAAGTALALLNGIALFLYLSPPGGTRRELMQQSQQIRDQIALTARQATRLKNTASKVQSGSVESAAFETRYFLPKRLAYVAIVEEIQRMAKASGIDERDAAFSEEPIEGTADLTLLTDTANYEGSYSSLMKFLYEADHSPMLLMLDGLAAAPQQKNGQINTSIRFQAIVREPAPGDLDAPSSGGPR
jgi:hypothetical protein